MLRRDLADGDHRYFFPGEISLRLVEMGEENLHRIFAREDEMGVIVEVAIGSLQLRMIDGARDDFDHGIMDQMAGRAPLAFKMDRVSSQIQNRFHRFLTSMQLKSPFISSSSLKRKHG